MKWSKFFSLIMLTTSYIVVLLTFLTAYVSNMRVLITVNSYGEANVELIIFVCSLPPVTQYLIKETLNLIRDMETTNRNRGTIHGCTPSPPT